MQVWSRRPRKGFDAIPYRVDEHEIALREQDPFGTLMPQQVISHREVSCPLSCSLLIS